MMIKVNFVINGTDLLLRDFNIFTTTKANHRAILEQLKQMAIQNNTTGASIYDLGNVIKAESISEVSDILKDAEIKTEMQRQQEMQQQEKMQQEQLQAKQQEEQQKIQWKMKLNPEQYQLRISQKPTNIAEGFAYRKESIFPQGLIQKQLKKIEDKEYHYEQIELNRTHEGIDLVFFLSLK